LQRVSHRRLGGLAGNESRILHHTQQHDGDADIQQGANDQRGNDAKGQVALRVARLFSGGGNGIETDIGEKDNCAAGHNAAKSRGSEGLPVGWVDERAADHQEDQDGADLDGNHHVVGFGRFPHAAN
jgi:hypothetical protein